MKERKIYRAWHFTYYAEINTEKHTGIKYGEKGRVLTYFLSILTGREIAHHIARQKSTGETSYFFSYDNFKKTKKITFENDHKEKLFLALKNPLNYVLGRG